MDNTRFEQMVARVERDSVASPRLYQFRVLMLTLFGFGVLAVLVGMAGAGIFLLAGVALALALTGFKAAILILKLGKVLLLLAWPLWLLIKFSVQALFVRLPPPNGLEIQREQAPGLFAAMAQMRQRMKGPRFHHVLITNDMNAAVVQRPMFGLVGWPRNYLILGLPLLETLSPQEALAVVAHEYGHLAGSHSRFGAYIYRLRNSWGTIQALAAQWRGVASKPLQKLVGWYAPYFNAYTFVLARTNEYQADAASAELVGAQVMACALKRVNVASADYEQFMGQVLDGIKDQAQPPADLAVRWAAHTRTGLGADELQAQSWLQVALDRKTDLADTHPALSQRLQALLRGDANLSTLPAPVAGPSAAETWMGSGLNGLRTTLQKQWHQNVAQPWEARHQELQAQRQRLLALQALEAPGTDDELALIRLRMQLEPDAPADLARLQAFNARHPNHVLGMFLEGSVRLQSDDRAGLDTLERVMALDPDATKAACERAHAYLLRHQERELAKAYADRWQVRDELERRQAFELGNLNDAHPVVSPTELTELDRVKAIKLVQAYGTGVKRAYLARRVLPSMPTQSSYALMLELGWLARLRRQEPAIVQRMAEQVWPMHVVIFTAHGSYKSLPGKLRKVPKALLVG